MTTSHEIFYDNDRLCITLAIGDNVLKGYDSPANKQSAFLYHAAHLEEVDWQSLQMVGDRCCMVFMPNDLFSGIPVDASELATSLRPRSLELLRNLSYAIEQAGDRLFWNLNSIPLSNIMFFENGDILLLSDQMGDAMDRFELDQQRRFNKDIWYVHNCAEPFARTHFLFQLLYFALTGIAPFESEAVRENEFKAIPIGLLFPEASSQGTEGSATTPDLKTIFSQIDKSLSDNKKFQYSIKKPYLFFREIIDSLLNVPPALLTPGDNPNMKAYFGKIEKRAKVKVFFRKKGVKVACIIAACAIVLSIIGFYVYNAVKPPLTRDLNEVEIIQYYYDALNDLDTERLSEPLKNGYDSPDFSQVTYLFITSKMQFSLEGHSLVKSPTTWQAGGMGPLPPSSIIYGVTDLSITEVSPDVYRATTTLWTSSNELDETNTLIEEEGMTVYKYQQVTEFTFRTRGDWREITNIENISLEPLETIHVDYVSDQSPTLGL